MTEEKTEADMALLLDEKIEERVLGILRKALMHDTEARSVLAEIVRSNSHLVLPYVTGSLPNDPAFVANIGRKLGQREANNWSN
jgi:general stress protein YciG